MGADLEPAIRVFLSYAHADETVLEFIEPFKTSLKHLAFADQGRTLDIFVDRDSIRWGDDWQESIREGIESATVFMPVVTRQYFDRSACREELLSFYNEAKSLGATSLILPVVILGHAYISEDSQDVAARIIHERQYRDLKDVWVEGPQSAAWRRAMIKLAGELVDAATSAERVLAGTDAGLATVMSSSRHLAGQAAQNDDAPGAVEVGEAFEFFQQETERLLLSMAGALSSFTTILSAPDRLNGVSQAEARRILLEISAELSPLGVEFQERGREFETVAVRTDEIVRGYVQYLKANDLTGQLELERQALAGVEDAMVPVLEAEGTITDFLNKIRPMEVVSAPLRKSLRGFREGAKAVKSGLSLMRGWPRLLED